MNRYKTYFMFSFDEHFIKALVLSVIIFEWCSNSAPNVPLVLILLELSLVCIFFYSTCQFKQNNRYQNLGWNVMVINKMMFIDYQKFQNQNQAAVCCAVCCIGRCNNILSIQLCVDNLIIIIYGRIDQGDIIPFCYTPHTSKPELHDTIMQGRMKLPRIMIIVSRFG